MIRAATISDVESLLDVGQRCSDGSYSMVGFNREDVRGLMERLIENDDGIFLTTDKLDGMIAGLVYPHPFNSEHLTGQELFWWSEGVSGAFLYKEFMRQVKNRNVKSWIMVHGVDHGKVGNFYLKDGFAAIENSYIKVF